jgi:hypothetical protein
VTRLDVAHGEGINDAKAGRPPRARVRGPHTRLLYKCYLVGYAEQRAKMRRTREHAQLELFP